MSREPTLPEAGATPEARVVRLPERRADPPSMRLEGRDWELLHPMLAAALDGLARDERFDALLARALPLAGELPREQAATTLRRFLWRLHKAGAIEIPFEPAPALFAARYERVEELGRGGVGIAHLCRDREAGAQVVVKHAWGYLRPLARNDRALREEADVLRALRHEGIARVHDAFEERGLFHLVRDYADGPPLSPRRGRALSPAARLTLLGEVVAILEHAHGAGYLMMDPKPANFASRGGHAFLIDAGGFLPHAGGKLAREHPSGTRGYVAPEFLARQGADVRSAIFSFGCLALALATGAPPGHRWGAAERAAALDAAGATSAERALVLACCAELPDARPQGFAEVAQRVERARKEVA